MGRVFSYQEIINGHVPTPLDFQGAQKDVREKLSDLINAGEVVGGMFYGSVTKGTPGIRSDIDLLVITADHEVVSGLTQMASDTLRKFDVPLEIEAIPEDLAQIGSHTIDAGFYHHLLQCGDQEFILGADPREILKIRKVQQKEVHQDYLDAKMRRLREGLFTQSDDEYLRVLQRALEVPIAVGRRTLIALGIPILDDNGDDNDGKRAVERTFREVFDWTPLIDGFNEGVTSDRAYTRAVMDVLSGKLGEEEYEAVTIGQEGQSQIQKALQWTSEISLFYRSTFEGIDFTPEGQIAGKERM